MNGVYSRNLPQLSEKSQRRTCAERRSAPHRPDLTPQSYGAMRYSLCPLKSVGPVQPRLVSRARRTSSFINNGCPLEGSMMHNEINMYFRLGLELCSPPVIAAAMTSETVRCFVVRLWPLRSLIRSTFSSICRCIQIHRLIRRPCPIKSGSSYSCLLEE